MLKFGVCFFQISHFGQPGNLHRNVEVDQRFTSALKIRTTDHPSQQARIGAGLLDEWSFARGTKLVIRQKVSTFIPFRKSFEVQASCNSFQRLLFSRISHTALHFCFNSFQFSCLSHGQNCVNHSLSLNRSSTIWESVLLLHSSLQPHHSTSNAR